MSPPRGHWLPEPGFRSDDGCLARDRSEIAGRFGAPERSEFPRWRRWRGCAFVCAVGALRGAAGTAPARRGCFDAIFGCALPWGGLDAERAARQRGPALACPKPLPDRS